MFSYSIILGSRRYEVAWADWARADDSNTTWVRNLPDRPDLVNSWKKAQNARRAKLAAESTWIEIGNFLDVHNSRTHERAQALDEKTRAGAKKPKRYDLWDVEIKRHLQELEMDGEEGLEREDRPKLLRMSKSGETRSRASSTVVSHTTQSMTPGSSRSTPATSVSGKHLSRDVGSPVPGPSLSTPKPKSHKKQIQSTPSVLHPSKLGVSHKKKATKTRIDSTPEGSEEDDALSVSVTKPSPATSRRWLPPSRSIRPLPSKSKFKPALVVPTRLATIPSSQVKCNLNL